MAAVSISSISSCVKGSPVGVGVGVMWCGVGGCGVWKEPGHSKGKYFERGLLPSSIRNFFSSSCVR